MNVYDFDGTIYDGDSTKDFYIYCVKKDIKLLRYLPLQGWAFAKYFFKMHDKTKFKEGFFCFLRGINNIDFLLDAFWMKNSKKIKAWYLAQKKDDDLIISASPHFLLKGMCDKLGLSHLIASEVDKKSGRFKGENCLGEEKVARFKKEYPNNTVDKFYSDSNSDAPMAKLAKESFFVKKDEIIKW